MSFTDLICWFWVLQHSDKVPRGRVTPWVSSFNWLLFSLDIRCIVDLNPQHHTLWYPWIYHSTPSFALIPKLLLVSWQLGYSQACPYRDALYQIQWDALVSAMFILWEIWKVHSSWNYQLVLKRCLKFSFFVYESSGICFSMLKSWTRVGITFLRMWALQNHFQTNGLLLVSQKSQWSTLRLYNSCLYGVKILIMKLMFTRG